ncbi:MAG: thioredoxin domain-containing protein, partial [Hyphomicrobiales bacterium]|nr:thioredoxin domain-containing protein [Hyphomicrobiales bacterium]
KDNPVHWRPWGPAALEEAQRTNKPILLSVGYAACHWCHVMAHESFEDAETAEVMNRLFVNIKVDREERPDIDQIYMSALHALGEQGGWPLTMFLTPTGKPIWGGTYFPKTARFGRPGFVSVLEEVARIFRDEPDKIETNTTAILNHLSEQTRPPGGSVTLDTDLLDQAADRLLGLMDGANGGTRGAPRFPQTSLLTFLWRAGERTGNSAFQDATLLTLRHIAQGGIYDHLGGGFARYSVDERWLVPHFEKMLYDNAQLIESMTQAFVKTEDPLFRQRIEETIGWLEREMMTPSAAFAASIDADSEGVEGKFYVWQRDEVDDGIGADAELFSRVYDVLPNGNWEGSNILNRLHAMMLGSDEDEARLATARQALLSRRASRIRPATDDKILADWNGLTIASLAFASATFKRPDWLDLARNAFAFITGPMARDGRLTHSWRDGKSVFPGLATDYANMIKAAIALYEATLETDYIAEAERLAHLVRAHHWNVDQPGFFLSADDAEALIVRPLSATDEATPSANSVMAKNLVRLWHLTGNDAFQQDGDDLIEASGPAIAANLFASAGMLSALDFRMNAVDVVIIRPTADDTTDLMETVRSHWTPNTILSVHTGSARLPDGHPAAGKESVANRPTAYVCRGETCSLP